MSTFSSQLKTTSIAPITLIALHHNDPPSSIAHFGLCKNCVGFFVSENFNVDDTVPDIGSATHTRRPGRDENTLISRFLAGSIDSTLRLVKKQAPYAPCRAFVPIWTALSCSNDKFKSNTRSCDDTISMCDDPLLAKSSCTRHPILHHYESAPLQ